MEASTLRLGFIVLTLGVIFGLLYRDRKNVERSGILFFRRTKKGIDWIDRIAKKAPRLWKVYGWGGVLAAAVSIPVIFYSIFGLVKEVFKTGEPAQGAGLVYPSTGSSVTQSAGAIGVPAEYWFISIAVLMVVHELSHGIIARSLDFEINSVGVLVLGVIPGAFVEPKGENMLPGGDTNSSSNGENHGAWDQGNWISRIKVLAAGSWANYLTAAVFLLLALGITSVTSYSNGVVYQAQQDYPGSEVGMTNGTLLAVGNQSVRNGDIRSVMENVQPGDQVVLRTTEGNFTVTTTSKEGFDQGYIGLRFTEMDRKYKQGFEPYSSIIGWLSGLMNALAFLNLGIGLFNMFPAKPLDGGHILDAVVERFAGEEYRHYVNIWSAASFLILVGVIVYSIIGPF